VKSPVDRSTLASPIISGCGQSPDEEVVALLVEHRVGECGARRDDLYHVALDHALGLLGVFDLLADSDFAAHLDELGQVAFHRVVRHAGEGHIAGGFAVVARGEGEAEQLRGLFGVFVEHLVKITHAKEQDGVLVLALEVHVLLHRRGEFGFGWHCSA
tara:strand:+ start:187 stop:660 length:474 start_codon:yes stop_codon:yes gene_type:complete